MDENNIETLPIGYKILNRYTVTKLLGVGGMGSVYLADDAFLEGNKVAVKVLHKEFLKDSSQEKRFLREIQLMNSVSNPNVVRTFDAGRDKDILFFTMEFVLGEPLDEYLSNRYPLNINHFYHLALQICEGLVAIHEAGIIHRDLKTSNIMVINDTLVKITDFGIARPKASNLTQTREIIGSVDYISPEVWLGNEVTQSVDIYSLGIIFYQLLTNQLPFYDEEVSRIMMLHIKRPPTPPIHHVNTIPTWLNQLILKMLAKTPADRPKSIKDVMITIEGNSQTSISSSGKFKIGQNTGKYNIKSPEAQNSRKNRAEINERNRKRAEYLKRKKAIQFVLVSCYFLCCSFGLFYFYKYYQNMADTFLLQH